MCCGHITDFRVDRVKSKSYECKVCLEKEISKYYSDIGLTIVDRPSTVGEISSTRGSRYVKFDKCGHFKEVQIVHAKEGIVSCKECLENKVVSEFQLLGYTVVHPSTPNNKKCTRLVRINKCGHFKEVQLVHAQEGHVMCKECLTTRLIDEAKIAGIEFIGESVNKKKGYKNYKLPCGCTLDLHSSNIAKNSWNCNKCNTTYLERESSVYLYKITKGNYSWLKLGYSCNTNHRKNTYGLDDISECLLLFNHKLPTGRLAKEIEQSIHRIVSEHRLSKMDMKLLMKANGHTECYPLSMEDEILNILSEKTNNL